MQTEMEFKYTNNHSVQPTLNGGLIHYDDVLPNFSYIKELYLDFETTSCNLELTSLNPFRNCWVAGIAICADDGPACYIPVNAQNEQRVSKWLFDIFNCPTLHSWINHSISYDAHVLYNNFGIIPASTTKLIDTLTQAKLIDSDRFQHNLTVLSKDWLQDDISQYEQALKPYLFKNKDYGRIPIDIIGVYAIQDVITNRKLYKYVQANLPETCNTVRDTEIALTKVLIEIERNGLRVKPEQLAEKEKESLIKMIMIEDRLEKLTGKVVRPHTNSDCFDLLCNYYGLPVLGWTDGGQEGSPQPSFDKHALAQYVAHPSVQNNAKLKEAVNLIIEYRKTNTTKSLFIDVFKEENIDGLLHSHYNQAVRTGRLSCQKPNAQQQNKASKELVHPYSDNEVFVNYDMSQIEFRLIAHYIENPYLIKSYQDNPDVDFHQWIADMCEIDRQPAKSMNFGLGFGMGKTKMIKMLESNMNLVGNLMNQVREMNIEENQQQAAFHNLASQRAVTVYNKYHNTLPELKKISRKATAVCTQRGYVFNLYGRQRSLPPNRAHIAFNFLNQSSAADLIKERLVFLHEILQDSSIKLTATVHDSILFSMPKELAEDARIIDTIAKALENPPKEFLVPIRVSCGIGKDWRKADEDSQLRKYENAVDLQTFQELIK